jgi:sugar O-acyltransferase (sialic acid O-acetyltransferase NeuD family)
MKTIIFGAGTYGEVYLHYLRDAGVDVVGFLDDDSSKHGSYICDLPVLGGIELLETARKAGIDQLFCPVGINAVRLRVNGRARSMGLRTPNFVHKSAIIDSLIPPESGIYVLPGVVIMPCVTLSPDTMISMGVSVAHHTTLVDGVFLSTGVSVGAGIRLGSCAYVGMSATLVTGKCRVVGARSIVGAGAVVLSDIPDDSVFAGVPARPLVKS